MTAGDRAQFIYMLVWLGLVASALLTRRLPWKHTVKLALVWLAIFATLFGIAAFRDDFSGVWRRLVLAVDPQRGIVTGGALHVPMGDDGHFRVRAEINGVPVRFLIDSGATTTALSAQAVAAANIKIDENGFGVAIDTANGTVIAQRIGIAQLTLGPIERRDLHAITSSAFGDTNVLGMNFLSSLHRWGVEGRVLVLEP